MNDFDHADISRRLALAIGWRDDQIFNDHDGSYTSINLSHRPSIQTWKDFDYRDPLIIWPIAERFNTFPMVSVDGWTAWFDCTNSQASADTAALAVAMAVIKSQEKE
jgi:hypothetical protein